MVELMNVHLRPQVEDNGGLRCIGFAIDHSLVVHLPTTEESTSSIRLAEIKYLLNGRTKDEKTGSSLPLLIIGDFNEKETALCITYLKSLGFNGLTIPSDTIPYIITNLISPRCTRTICRQRTRNISLPSQWPMQSQESI